MNAMYKSKAITNGDNKNIVENESFTLWDILVVAEYFECSETFSQIYRSFCVVGENGFRKFSNHIVRAFNIRVYYTCHTLLILMKV